MEEDRNTREAMSLAEHLGVVIAAVKRRWWLLVLLPLLIAGAVYWLVERESTMYTASATILVTQPSAEGTGLASDVESGTLLAQTYAPLVTSSPVLGRVVAELGLNWTARDLADHVSASSKEGTQLIVILASTSDPQMSANIANATGQEFVTWLAVTEAASSQESIESLQSGIDQISEDIQQTASELAELGDSADPANQAQIANLGAVLDRQQETYGNLLELQHRQELERLALQGQARLISPAALPDPDRSLDLLFVAVALVVGLALAALGVALIERASPRIRSPRDVRRTVEQPLLGVIPRTRRSAVDLLAAPQTPASRAIRWLGARLRIGANERGLGTVVVTSVGWDGQGERDWTGLAANLGLALAQAGQRVVLVDGNLRRPRWHVLVSRGDKTAGLANLLEQPDARLDDLLIVGPHPQLWVLLAGTSRRTPDELLSKERLAEVVSMLEASADAVIIDAPPMVEWTTDVLLISTVADRALVVVRAGRTRPRTLETALSELKLTGVDGAAVVLAGGRRDSAA